jgi:hypothetical protein
MMAASSYRRDFLLIEEPSDNTMKLEKNKWGRVVYPRLSPTLMIGNSGGKPPS